MSVRRRPGLFVVAAAVAFACAVLPIRADAESDVRGSSATACNGDYCIVGGTTTLTLSEAWRRRSGLRVNVVSPAAQRGNRIVLPIAAIAGAADGELLRGSRSSWYLEGCDVVPGGGGVFHRGAVAITTRGSRFVVRALVNGPRFRLEIPPPQTWKTGQRPRDRSVVFTLARWKVLSVTAAGFKAEAQLRAAPGLTKGFTIPPGIAGTLALDVLVSPRIELDSHPTCLGGATSALPRVTTGPLWPLIAGSIAYGTPLQRLYEKLGRPPGCTNDECGWHSGPDTFGPLTIPPVDGRTGVQARLRHLQLSTDAVARSKLKGWRSPEGIRIGSTLAELRGAYPKEGTSCIGNDCALGLVTRPYAVASENGPTRQRFDVVFHYDRNEQLVKVIRVDMFAEEGTCRLTWRHERDYAEFYAKCAGPLVSARLEPVGASPRFTENRQAGGVIRSVVDGTGAAITPGGIPRVIEGSTGAARATWQVTCDFGPFYECPPGRGSGPALWAAGGFEEWELTFTGYSVQPAPPKAAGAGPAIPPMRFVADFLDRPPFTIVISRDY